MHQPQGDTPVEGILRHTPSTAPLRRRLAGRQLPTEGPVANLQVTPSHVIGFDDAPFPPEYRGNVPVVGAVFARLRLEGVLYGQVRRDGINATHNLTCLIADSKFARQLQLVLLQGIALAGFNVVDITGLHDVLRIPILVVVRRRPRLDRVRRALLARVPGGARKWELIARLGPPEPAAGVFVQRVGLSLEDAERVIRRLAVNGSVPEPLRTAHLIAGAIATGESRGRV
ncbi:MAG: DUF99 family protein [Gemmatimonadetes bacterium]|nr:DUF99 family protein [Gemmatimonadota bacterium]